MEEQVYGTMQCGCCGAYTEILYTETEQDGSIITVSYYGKCKVCGTVFGSREWYRCADWDWISEAEAKKVLDKLSKL